MPIHYRSKTTPILLAILLTATALTTTKAPAQTAAHKAPPAGIKNVFWQPNQLQQGSPAFFTVEFDRSPRRVSATWIGKTLTFFHGADPKIWFALAGADLETKPGTYDIAVTAVLASGRPARSVKPVELAAANFQSGTVDVPENFVQPDDASKKQIAADTILKNRAFAHATPHPLWSGNFLKPVEAPSTPSFGESRILNEEMTSTHRGTDFPIKEGSPVIAANAGTVVLAKELFYEGNCIIIDHGDKFFTIYMHLSKLDVKLADKVRKGAKLGLSGATGRVTGPHMHFGVRWNGAYLDPLQLLSLTLPKTPAATEATHATTTHRRAR